MNALDIPMTVPAHTRLIIVENDKEAQLAYEAHCDGAMAFVEVCFGARSFRPNTRRGKRKKGPLFVFDHHGDRHEERAAFVQGYARWGCLRAAASRTLVVTGFPDEDACGCVASALGVIPHHSFRDLYPTAPEHSHLVYGRNLTHVAELTETVDLDPNRAIELDDTFHGRQLLAWREQCSLAEDTAAWWGGIDRMRSVFCYQSEAMVEAAQRSREDRLEDVHSAPHSPFGQAVAVDLSTYGRNSAYYREWLQRYPVLVALVGNALSLGSLSFVVRDMKTAERLFGPKGLLGVYRKLPAQFGHAGGREIIGGADRSRDFSFDQAKLAAKSLNDLIAA